jgi:hypothetical protein
MGILSYARVSTRDQDLTGRSRPLALRRSTARKSVVSGPIGRSCQAYGEADAGRHRRRDQA